MITREVYVLMPNKVSPCQVGNTHFVRTVKGKQQTVPCPSKNWRAREERQTETARLNALEAEYKEQAQVSGAKGRGIRIAVKAGVPLAGAAAAVKIAKGISEFKHLAGKGNKEKILGYLASHKRPAQEIVKATEGMGKEAIKKFLESPKVYKGIYAKIAYRLARLARV